MSEDDNITLGEVNRTVQRGHAELLRRLEAFELATVRRDVYDADKLTTDANKAALLLRVESVEHDLEVMAVGRRQLWTLGITAFIFPLIVAIIVVLLNTGRL